MGVNVYDGGELVAAFRFGKEPAYHGAGGAHVRQLVNAPHWQYNPWQGGFHFAGLKADTPEWLASSVCEALAGTRYRTDVIGLDEVPETEGIP